MTIRVYPNRLEGEPLEVHETSERLSIADWMLSVAPAFTLEAENCHPTVTINGLAVPPAEWPLTFFGPDDAVDVHIEPRGLETATIVAIISAVISVAAIAIAMSMTPPRPRKQGAALEDANLMANTVRWGDPIPEIAGSPLTFPDFIMPQRRYYVNQKQQWVDSLVCIGMGSYQINLTQVFIGETPAPSLGDDFQITFYGPGETLSSSHREWWHTPEEVGFTTLGGAGMTLGPASGIPATWTNNISFSGTSITGSVAVPSAWEPGMILRVLAEHPITFAGGSIQSALLDTLDLSASDQIELTGTHEGVYTIASITPGTGADPGDPTFAVGSAAPVRLDFDMTPASLTINVGSSTYGVTLSTGFADVSELVDEMNDQLSSAAVVVTFDGSDILTIEQTAPFGGETMILTGDVSDLLGTPTITPGVAATPASPNTYNIAGADFGSGTETAAAGRPDFLYSIVSITGSTIDVNPVGESFWGGFPAGISNATSYVSLDPGSQEGGWVGPFVAVPPGKTADAFEVDVFYPAGLIWYTSKGYWRETSSGGMIQWRVVGSGTWNDVPFTHTAMTPDQIGFTVRVTPPTPGRFEVRMRGDGWDHKKQWTGLRSRIVGAPATYPGMTVAHVRLRSGDQISGAVENKLSIRAMRILPTAQDPEVMEPTRDIAPFFLHMMSTVGYGRDMIDIPKIQALHSIWQSRGDTFDLSVNGNSTLKTVANYCLQAGFAELTLHRGLISAARDAEQTGSPPRVYSPQELVSPLVESSESIMPDDIDGVDVEYVDYTTGRRLVESYRLPGDSGVRVQKIQAPGVTGRTQAWRIAARHRRMAAYRRTAYKGVTELAAMNSYYMDYIGLQDGIPEWGQSAFVIDYDADELTLTLSEDVLPITGDPVIMLRRADGTATEPVAIDDIDGRVVTLEEFPSGIEITNDPNGPTIVYLGSIDRITHKALMVSVRPSAEGRVEFQAVNMDNRVYAEDDNEP